MQKSSETKVQVGKVEGRRGRPRAFDREAALAQATRLFWEKGYEATSIADLGQAMGIGSPSLYAAFGSKAALFTEAIQYYSRQYEHLVWSKFDAAMTAREAISSYLYDSAVALSSGAGEAPRGCMITLSMVGSEGHAELGQIVAGARAQTLNRLESRLEQAVASGEIPSGVSVRGLARFVQSVQAGMSILARDLVPQEELENVAQIALSNYDIMVESENLYGTKSVAR